METDTIGVGGAVVSEAVVGVEIEKYGTMVHYLVVLPTHHSLVPRPLPPFQCCTQKRERAWYQMSRDKRHPYEGWSKGEIKRGRYSGRAGSGNSAAKS